MKERPILFNGDMIRAILSGDKTQTRRPIRPQPTDGSTFGVLGILREKKSNKFIEKGSTAVFHESREKWIDDEHPHAIFCKCPFGKVGERLWVRETWNGNKEIGLAYRATNPELNGCPWRPSIHMPRWASRINLEITDIRVERVQGISEADAQAEGIVFIDHGKNQYGQTHNGWNIKEKAILGPDDCLGTAKWGFANLWTNTYEKRGHGWYENPWVWAVSFKRIP